jgi:ATP-binding cassette, subfamily F, member 3
MEGSATETALEVLLKADTYSQHLQQQQEQLEKQLEQTNDSDVELLEEIALKLGEISEELEALNVDQAEINATKILEGLQFTKEMIHSPTEKLSGGWRVRLALARALFLPSDILLLDETSNHLDIWGVQWLTNYLTNAEDSHKIVVVVSHDRAFLDAICTDIMVIEHGKLKTFPGSWSDYELTMEEKLAHKKQILDASERQKAKAQQFIQKQQAMANKKSADPNKQRQAKMMKDKKLDRIGNYRE